MAAMVGARRALLAARYSPRGAIAASTALVPPYRRVDSLPRLPAERGCVSSWAPHRGAGSLASERTDEDCDNEWGQNNAGSYENFRSNHFSHQLQRDAPSAGSRSAANFSGGSEQTYGSGGLDKEGKKEMAAMLAQMDRFLIKSRENSPNVGARTAIVASAAPEPPYQRVDSLHRLPAERGGVPSSVPHRGAGSLASERTDEDCHHEWGQNNAGSYGNSRSNSNHFSHQLQSDAPSAGSRSATNIGGGSEQPYRSGGSYGSPNANHPYTGASATNEQPGYDATQYSPRGPIAASAVPDAPYRHVDSLARLPDERGCVPSWIPQRGAGSLAFERTDEDCRREWGENNAGSYGNSHSNHFSHQLQRDAPSAGSRSVANIGGGSEQPYRSGGSYCSPNANMPYTGARSTSEQPGYDATQYSPRGAIAESAAPELPYRCIDSLPRLPAERGCVPSWVPHRGAGSFASERTDEYCHCEWGESNAGSYGNFRSNHFSHQLQRDAPSAGSRSFVNIGGGSEQPYGGGGSYGSPSANQLYNFGRATNEQPGYDATQYSPRGAIVASAAPDPSHRRIDSLPSLPAERGGVPSWVPHRGAGSLASERTDDDCHREWGENNAGSYGNSRSNHFSHQLQRDAPSACSRSPANHGGGSEQPYRSGGSYGSPNANHPYTGARATNEQPGYDAMQYSPRGAIATSAVPDAPYRHVDSLPRLPAERGGAPSWVPHRGAGSLASERTDEDNHREWVQNNAGSYGNSCSNHFSHQLQRDAPSTGSRSFVNIGGGSEQPYRSGGSYGSPNANQPYTCARATNEQPGYDAIQFYRTSRAYNQQSHGGHLPNARLRYNGAEANNTQSGYGKGQTYHGHYGYGPSGQEPNSVGYDQEVFRQQQYVDHRSGGGYPDRPGNPTSQYANPTHSHKEHVAGFQQGSTSNYGCNASQASQSPYVPSQADTRSTPQGYSMYLNTDAQRLPRGIHQEKHPHVQPTTSFGNHSDSVPHQGDIYYQPLPGNPSNGGLPSEVSNEVSRIRKGTVEELEKLCEDSNIKEALEVQAMLQRNGTMLHAHQYFKLMQACGDTIALEEARVIHSQMSESSIVVDTDVQNKILEMYAKCGSMEDAKNLFSTMDHRSLASWNTMISGFVHNGHGEEATDFFDQFKQTGDKPDAVMFTHIFLACGILGSIDEGMLHFESMQKDFGITPTMEHYASIVSMLGQSGYIAEAHEFVERIPVEPSIEVWENLMNMCRLNGFLELGDRCAQIVERLDSSRLNEQSKMGLFPVDASDLAKEKGRKKGGVAEARSKVHEYRAGDRSHPDTLKIYEELRYLSVHMKEAGYIADTRFVLHDVDQETKEDALLAHSERLAISYGLITSSPRSPIRVIKNLRSCGDCHTAFKIISKLVGRLIIARDAKRFHHFENGVCSCKDYW